MTENQKEFKAQTPDTDLQVIDRRHTAQAPAMQDDTPNALVMMAMQKGYTPELIEKMMDLAERNERNVARRAYFEAMSKFAANPPDIEKDRSVGYENRDGTSTGYRHASLDNVTKKIQSALSICGLHASWVTSQSETVITVTCTITHKLGHSESTCLTAPPDNSGKKNNIQAIGSTISYLERYTILALTGLSTRDMDDDGQAAAVAEYISTDQVTEINDRISEIYQDKGVRFLKWLKIDSVETITSDLYQKAIKGLDDAQAALNKAKKQTREPGQEG